MKHLFLMLFSFVIANNCLSQNYFQEFPINISIASNGTQNRLECSTYDSTLQTIVYYNTDWITPTIIVTGNTYGKVCFITMTTPVVQNSLAGFIIYDFEQHQFKTEFLNLSLTSNQKANIISSRVWISVVIETYNGQYYYYTSTQYRYNMYLHQWISFPNDFFDNSTSTLWNIAPAANTDAIYEWENDRRYYYDPVSNIKYITEDVNYFSGIYNELYNDYFISYKDTWPLSNDHEIFYTYDAETHIYETYPRDYLTGDNHKGIFTASDIFNPDQKFFFIYDQSIHLWVSDSITSPFLTNIICKDRMVAYTDSISGQSRKIYFMTFNPIAHSWIKDSASVSGTMSGLTIQNGTVMWNDANGANIKGYNVNSGWGNYNTAIYLNFHLTDFTSQGHPMVHVRNYSIGTDSIYYNFGDGVVSLDSRHAMWHSYRESGTYNICIFDSTGTQNWCVPVSFVVCSQGGIINVTNDTICANDSTELSISSSVGVIQWQRNSGNGWIDETGPGSNAALYKVTAAVTTSFRAMVTNGACVSAFSNEIQVKVHQVIGNTYMSDSAFIKCSSGSANMYVYGANSGITYQWQINQGTGWTNINFATSNGYSAQANNAEYRVVMKSSLCFTDTSDVITVSVLPTPSVPVTTNDFTCGAGIVDLQASGTGQMHWYNNNITDSLVGVGNVYSPYITGSTVFKVKSCSGSLINFGPADYTIAGIDSTSNQKKGIRLLFTMPVTFEDFKVYPLQSGNLRLRINKAGTNYTVAYYNKQVIANPNGVKVTLGASLLGNTLYDLIVDSSSVPLLHNNGGVNYPFSDPSGIITITGYVDSIFHNTSDYYNFYSMNISSGCKSSTASVTGDFYSAFNIAAITASGPLTFCQGGSVQLNAYFGLFGYQWKRNGTTVSTSGSSFVAKWPGFYTVIMNSGLCYDTSAAVQVRVPCAPPTDPGQKIGNEQSYDFYTYYESSTGQLIINLKIEEEERYEIAIFDMKGKKIITDIAAFSPTTNYFGIDISSLSNGLYSVQLHSQNHRLTSKILKL